MDAPASSSMLYLVGVGLLLTIDLLTCVHSQGGVWFSLRNTTYQNYSNVTLEDIGENDTALLCMTNFTACCEHNTGLGKWYFPNGSEVCHAGHQWDFYSDRSKMVVRLHRRGGRDEGIYRCEIPDAMNITQTMYIGVYSAGSGSILPTPQTVKSPSPPTVTVPVSSSTQLTKNDEATMTPSLLHSNMQPTMSAEAFIPTGTVSISNIQPTDNPPSDGTTTTSVIIVVAVVTILVVIVVGVVILVIIFRAKKRKQRLVISKLQSVTTENEDIEMKLKPEGIIEKETNSSAYQSPYAEIRTEAPPKLPTKSEELMECLNLKSTVTGGYSEIELEQADTKYALPAKSSRHVNISNPIQSVYQNIDQHPSTTSVQEAEVYTVPDTTSSPTVETPSEISETVYSEPIQPSLFADAVGTADSENLQPYGPIYTIPINLPKSKKVLLKVSGGNIKENCELGMGRFGKVILAETVGLSAKDLRLSESDDDKSKSTLVAVKKLKSDAPNATKLNFEKEVNFMSRLTDKNVIRILGVCYEDTPFIMMEYMEKGDLNQYLQKFKTLSSSDSEPQGQITTSTLVHMATQIASAMKYLVSHNYVHRDLATRNCLVGPNYLVKLSDFGMSRSLYSSHYYRIHGRFSLPVRWMAYECFYGKFSQKSDVWAFGVTMWEIFTLAKEQPYNDMSDEQVVENALKGKNRKTLPRPDMCPLKVYKIMLECWEHNSDQRTTFEELFQLLTSVCQNV